MENEPSDANKGYIHYIQLRETNTLGVITVPFFSSPMWGHMETIRLGLSECHSSD